MKVGMAWVNHQMKPIMAAREIRRGKSKGKIEVQLTRGRKGNGHIRPGKKRKIPARHIIYYPE